MDQSYVEALEAAAEPHRVLLGPAPCHWCGAWVEWAGVRWMNAGTRGSHECAPFLTVPSEPEVVAAWSRPAAPSYAVMQAYPLRPVEPAWAQALGAVLLVVAVILAALFVGALAARLLAGVGQ